MNRPGQSHKVAPNSTRILVVDDEEPNVVLLSSLLSSQNYVVFSATDGEAALSILRQQPVDLVLLDMMMPRMDGIEVCAHIRGVMGLRSLPIIFTTALSDRESRVRGKEAGADDFLVKPVDVLELFVRVENLLRFAAHHKLVEEGNRELTTELARAAQRIQELERVGRLGSVAASVGAELLALSNTHAEALSELIHIAQQTGAVDRSLVERFEQVGQRLSAQAERLTNPEGTAAAARGLECNAGATRLS